MSQVIVSKRYARALFELAIERKILDKVAKDMGLIQDSLSTSEELLEWMVHPTADAERKKGVFKVLFRKVTPTTLHFLYVVIDHHRENILDEIITGFNDLVREERGEIGATITSAFPLSKSDRKQLIESFHKMLGKEITIESEVVDSDLLGGAVVRVADRIYDGSLKRKLLRFQQQMRKSSLET